MRVLLGASVAICVLSLSGCPSSHDNDDSGPIGNDGGGHDAAMIDAGPIDSGPDTGPPIDAGSDAGADDTGAGDTGAGDAGGDDAGADAGSDPCTTPGSVETQSCGHCGTLSRFCTNTHEWTYGPCMGEHGTCDPGATGLAPCGRCGQQAQFCDDTCGWVPMGACIGETGTCVPGTHTRVTTGCPAGQSRVETCSATCTFDDGPCEMVECLTGDTSTASCGMCGQLTRTCDATNHWVDGPCMNQGVCMPGATMTSSCMVCGSQDSTCSATCAWVAGTCTGGVTCPARPTPTCMDAMTLRTYDATPVCMAGACAYTERDVSCPAGCMANACVGGATLIDGLGGTTGYGPNELGPSDDGSSTPISLAPLSATGLNYYGVNQTVVYLNNNGFLSFGAVSMSFNAPPSTPAIAGLFGDVDTTGGGLPSHNEVVWAIDATHLVATWYLVGHYAHDDTAQNSFQIILTPRPDRAAGDFDVEMRFAHCGWWNTSTGSVWSGFDSHDGRTLALPGVNTAAVLDLCITTNAGMAGVWRYEVRNGIPTAP